MHNLPEWLSVALDPNHIIAEALFTIVFDGVIVAFLYGLVWKRMVLPKLKHDIHTEIDKSHNYKHKKKDK